MENVAIKKEYSEIFESFENIVKFILITMEMPKKRDIKDLIISDFIAKSFSLYKSVFILINNKQEDEAMALYRLLIERYFYLIYLKKSNSYQEFSDWSFMKTYESRNKMRSKTEFIDKETRKILVDKNETTKKYERLKKEKISWKEPVIKDIAIDSNQGFLYDFGYDLASSYVHPRADEGRLDKLRIVKNESNTKRLEKILHNTTLIYCSVFYLGIKQSSFELGQYIYSYYDSIIDYLSNKNNLKIKEFELLIMAELLAKIEKNK